jgi:hypothetical protein
MVTVNGLLGAATVSVAVIMPAFGTPAAPSWQMAGQRLALPRLIAM